MTKPVLPTPVASGERNPTSQVNTDLLLKGAMCALIGLSVLVSPGFMAPSELRATVLGASLVGWFGLVLGAVFLVQYSVRRWRIGRR
jgi:hypothetical protein